MSEKKVFNLPEIRDRLKMFREKLDFNSRAFALSIGLNDSNYGGMEKGSKPLGENTVQKIVAAHDLNPVWLYFGEGPMYNKYKKAAAELSFAKEPASPYAGNTRVQLSLKALKDAVAQLEEDLSGPKTEVSDINKAAAKADRASRKSNKSVSDK